MTKKMCIFKIYSFTNFLFSFFSLFNKSGPYV